MENFFEFKTVIVDSDSGQRLDCWLIEQLHKLGYKLGRRTVKQMCADRLVFVNEKPENAGYSVRANDVIAYNKPFYATTERDKISKLCDTDIYTDYEDEYFLIINKPRGMHCIMQYNDATPTLADYISVKHKECRTASKDLRECGLVQRLDYFTSGLVLVAKSFYIWEKLHIMLQQEKIHKSYIAFVEGVFPQGSVELNYRLNIPKNATKVYVLREVDAHIVNHSNYIIETHSKASKHAMSNTFCGEVLKASQCSFVEINVNRGCRHQVRAHLSAYGYPLVGDSLYGATSNLSEFKFLKRFLSQDSKEVSVLLDGFLLHANSISFCHPETRQHLECKSEFFPKSECV